MGARLDVEYIRRELARNAEIGVRPASQAELAVDSDLSKQMISDLMKGHRGASPESIRRIAQAMDVLPRKLLLDAVTAQQSAQPIDDGGAVPETAATA